MQAEILLTLKLQQKLLPIPTYLSAETHCAFRLD